MDAKAETEEKVSLRDALLEQREVYAHEPDYVEEIDRAIRRLDAVRAEQRKTKARKRKQRKTARASRKRNR